MLNTRCSYNNASFPFVDMLPIGVAGVCGGRVHFSRQMMLDGCLDSHIDTYLWTFDLLFDDYIGLRTDESPTLTWHMYPG